MQPGEYYVYLNTAAALPVSLINFTGKNNGNKNVLLWAVSNEQNIDYYQLERSYDGSNFVAISQIKATGSNQYSFIDNITSVSSFYYYRLKSVDKDGNFKYSAVITIKVSNSVLFAQVNPNPFKNKLIVTINSASQDKATLMLTDMSGRQLFKQIKSISAGNNIIEIDDAARLSNGTYLLTIVASHQTQNIKLIKGN